MAGWRRNSRPYSGAPQAGHVQLGVALCVFGGTAANFINGFQPGYFFIQYNVNTCSTVPPGY